MSILLTCLNSSRNWTLDFKNENDASIPVRIIVRFFLKKKTKFDCRLQVCSLFDKLPVFSVAYFFDFDSCPESSKFLEFSGDTINEAD